MYKINNEMIVEKFEDKTLIINARADKVYQLNEVESQIFDMLQHNTLENIISSFSQIYKDISVKNDIICFVNLLEQKQIILKNE